MLLWAVLASMASGAATAFVGATVHPVDQPPIEDAVLVVEDGRVVSVGPRADTVLPEGAEVVDVSGHHVIPGLVDTHSHIGGARLNDGLKPIQAGLSAVDAFDPTHDSVGRARAGGLTTVNVMPGSGKLMGGQTVVVKLRPSSVVDDLLMCRDVDAAAFSVLTSDRPERRGLCGGMKMANGTNPQGDGSDPKSRMGAAYLQREALVRGQDRLDTLQAEADKGASGVVRDLEDDALAELVAGVRTVHFHTHRADDVATILSLRREFGLDVVLHHVSEGWKLVDVLAEDPVPCSLIVLDTPGGKEEALQVALETGALLEARGVPVALHTDDPITDSRLFLRSAGLAVRGGMSPEGALRALTLSGAEMLHLDDRVGSLTPGKDADFVVLSGPPLSVWTHVEQTWIEGQLVFDRDNPADARLLLGGEGLSPVGLDGRPDGGAM